MTLKQPNLGSYLLSHQYSLVYYAGEGRYAGLTGIKLMRYIRVRVGLEPSNLKNLDPICERLPKSLFNIYRHVHIYTLDLGLCLEIHGVWCL